MLQLEVPAVGQEQFLQRRVELPRGSTQVWPGVRVQELMDPRIVGARFHDHELIDRELIDRALFQIPFIQANQRGGGGRKIRDAETWNMPAAQLLSLRAMLIYCHLRGTNAAHILDRWGNAMQSGDYSAPHCHYDADFAAVYFLDAGETSSDDPFDGAFELMDPRVPFCCTNGPERPIRGLMPDMKPGTMILFPAAFLHHVRPYTGSRPRLTLAWNISAGLPPADLVIDPTKPREFVMGKM